MGKFGHPVVSLACEMAAFDSSQIPWQKPWQPIDAVTAERFIVELQKEIPSGHSLVGQNVLAIGERIDCDDVLFMILENPPRFGVVHLTYKRETDPRWPTAEVFESLNEWITNRLNSDAFDWSCGDDSVSH